MPQPFRTRLCVVTDIEGYSRHTVPEHVDAQQRLLRIMKFACRHAGISRMSAHDRQDRGDGQLFLASPGIDETLAIPRLVIGLRHGLHRANEQQGSFGPIRLRAAIARGAIAYGDTGYPGRAPIEAARLVDCDEAKRALKDARDSDFVLVVTDELFQDVVRQDFPGLSSDEFAPIDVARKEYTGRAWLLLAKRGPAPGVDDRRARWEAVAVAALAAGVALGDWHGHIDADGDEGLVADHPDGDHPTDIPPDPGGFEPAGDDGDTIDDIGYQDVDTGYDDPGDAMWHDDIQDVSW